MMVRRIENARERFGRAAIELFRTFGYAGTTVPQIAAAAGLTERTFYRYFVDKPEVLFWRSEKIETEIVDAIVAADGDNPLEIVIDALRKAGRFFDENRADVVVRQAIVNEHIDLREREALKMRTLVETIDAALEGLGLPSLKARMTAETGVAIWRVAIDRWSETEPSSDFASHLRDCHADISAIVARCSPV